MKTKNQGTVISKHDNYAVISVERMKTHKIYGKKYRISKKLHVSDTDNQLNVGDKVVVEETRPVSKLIHWKIVKVI